MKQPSTAIITVTPFRAILGITLIVASIGYLSYREIKLGNLLGPEYDIIKDAYLLPNDKKVIQSFNRDVVLLQSSRVMSHPSYAPRDPLFDVQLGMQLELHRIVEYCQWHETSTNQTVHYYKDWSQNIIDSTSFKVKEGHENSNRDPYPKRDLIPKFVEAGAFKISYPFLEKLNLPTRRYQFNAEDMEHFPFQTLQNGFYYATPYWIYSRMDMVGVGEPIKFDGLKWISKEEEDTFENDCSPGDIRVGFEYKECPRVLTVVGIQNDDLIMPVRRVTGTYAISAPMNATAEEILGSLQTDEVNEVYMIRIYCGVGIFMGMLIMVGNFIPFRYVPHILRCFFTAVLSIYVVSLVIWLTMYGVENTFVIKTGIWFVSHFVFAILVNVMFYMIRLYRFAMRLEKEKKSE